MTTSDERNEVLDTLYSLPTSTALHTFQQQRSSLFVPETSTQSHVEAYLPRSAKGAARGPGRPQGHNSDVSLVSTGVQKPAAPVVRHASGNSTRIENHAGLAAHAAAFSALQVYSIRQRNSYSALSVSLGLYQALSDTVAVPESFNSYFVHFGARDGEVEIALPPRTKKHNASESQCMYGIRFVELNSRVDVAEPSSRWSLRQSAVYASYNPIKQQTRWIFVALSPVVQDFIISLWNTCNKPELLRSEHIHVAIYKTLVNNWRPYIVALTEEVEDHGVQLLGASPDNRGPLSMSDSGERQALLILENKVMTAELAVEATKRDLVAWTTDALPPPPDANPPADNETDQIYNAFSDMVAELEVASLRLKHLRLRVQSITSLVSSFLDLSNGFALQELAKESRAENEEMLKLNSRMHILAEKTTQDAAAVKVLTILTLIYLPATVMSNFFSTSFIGTAPGDRHIFVTDDWWILLVTSVPLTALTLYIWWVWSSIIAHQHYPWWWRFGMKQ